MENGNQLPCKAMFGDVRGSEIIEMVEGVTGAPCPCKVGAACPLVKIPTVRDSSAVA